MSYRLFIDECLFNRYRRSRRLCPPGISHAVGPTLDARLIQAAFNMHINS